VGSIPPREGIILREERVAYGKVYGRSAVCCAKTAELIVMPFGIGTRLGQRKPVLGGGVHWRHLA